MRLINKGKSVQILAAAAAAALAVSSSKALAQTWAGPGGNNQSGGVWDTASNWDTNTVPNSVGAAVTLPIDNTGATRTITFTAGTGPYTVGSINFLSAGANGPSTIGATDKLVGINLRNGGNGVSISV